MFKAYKSKIASCLLEMKRGDSEEWFPDNLLYQFSALKFEFNFQRYSS